MPLEHPVVVAGHGSAREWTEPIELAVAQVPAQLAVHVVDVRLRRAVARVRGQHPHVVAARAQVLDR